jgi:HAD superfamily hydrolase (TIGR01490 family)
LSDTIGTDGNTPPTQGQPAGFFDVDGTLGSTNVVLTYLAFLNHGASTVGRWLNVAAMVPKLPYYMFLDWRSRDRFCEVFYRKYADVSQSELEDWAEKERGRYWDSRLYAQALQKLSEHKAQGHRVVLVSGGLEPVLKPLAEALGVDALMATEPEVNGNHLTGRIVHGPLSGERKAAAMRELSLKMGIDLERSYAYGDSYADREFLETVGNPVAVNPDRRLKKLAKSRGWPIQNWGH